MSNADAHPPEDANPGPVPGGDDAPWREAVLVKSGQRFVFRYQPGEEADVIATITRMAEDAGSGVNWFDAAMLSHQIGAGMSSRLLNQLDD